MSSTPEPSGERTLRSGTTTSVRNPRRRARDSTVQESVKSAPRRKRSKIDAETFAPPRMADEEDAHGSRASSLSVDVGVNGNSTAKRGRGRPRKDRGVSGAVGKGMGVAVVEEEDKENHVQSHEDAKHMEGVDGDFGGGGRGAEVEMQTEMPMQMVVRGGRKGTVKRPPRGDGATVLTQNARYTVKLLPSTPRELRRDGLQYRGCLGAGHHALAVTRERAWIWDYASHAPVNNARTFDVPLPVKKSEPLPFGALVTHGGSSEMGLLLLHSTTGKITFYDSIERAASLGLFQERNTGVEGSIPGLFSGETVTDLIPADHAGFVVVLSSGRILQLLLRDAQGKARVFTQFLRATEQSSGGLFGSIKGFLGASGWKKDVAAVHARPLGNRGHMQVLSLTERAELQVWDIDWSGQCNFKSTIDLRELLINEANSSESPEMQGGAEDSTMLDFAIVEPSGGSSMEVATLGTEQPLELLVLLKQGGNDNCSYMLAEVILTGNDAKLGRLLDVLSYHRPPADADKPKLLLPKPQHTAMVAFPDAIVVTSIGEQEGDSPEAQLRSSYTARLTFEDAVFFRQSHAPAILSAIEEDNGRSSQVLTIAFVQGAGLVRLSADDPEKAPQMARIPVKSKVEQAVFYGSVQDNSKYLDFGRQRDEELAYATEEIEGATLAISDEILRSTSKFISADPTEIEAHLVHKAQAMHALVSHVRKHYPVLGKAAMWQLMWDAERVAAAQTLWNVFEGHVASASKKKRTATILDEVCSTLEKHHHHGDERGNDDTVRNFFVHRLHHVGEVFTLAGNFVKGIEPNEYPSEVTLRLVLEATDVWNKTLEAIYAFRTDNAAAYGMLPEFIEDGMLSDASAYAELPEFWTSTNLMLKSAVDMSWVSRRFANDEFEKYAPGDEKLKVVAPLSQTICVENAGLVQILCNIYQERIHWLASRPAQKDREVAEKLRENYDKAREDEFRALAGVAQTEAGLRLAEKYRDMHTLTVMVVGEVQFCVAELQSAPNGDEREAMLAQLNDMTARISKYFERFGDDWANAYFDEGFSGSQAGMMLRDAQKHWQDALSRYLRADPSRARICWIDDVTAKKDFAHAGRCLLVSGREQESKLWNKKVELSMAKLSMLATQEGLKENGQRVGNREFKEAIPESDLAVAEIQERLYSNIVPHVLSALDRQAELQLAMEAKVIKNQDLHALRSLLENCLQQLLGHEVLEPVDLIDVLTLIDNSDSTDDHFDEDTAALEGGEFYLALQVLNAIAPSLRQDQFETMLQLLWKRCYVYDSDIWNAINADSSTRSSDATQEILAQTAPWRTLELAMEDNFFDSPSCAVRFLTPSECLGAGCRTEDLSWRWESADLLDPILADNRTQDEQVQDLITSQRLDAWIQSVVEGVKAAIDDRAEERAAVRVGEKEFEEGYVEGEKEERGKQGLAALVNGGVKSEAYFEDEDEDESVDGHGVEESAEFDDNEEESGVVEESEGGIEGEKEDEDGDVEMA